MARSVALVLVLAACKGEDLGPVHDGISRVRVRVKDDLHDGTFLGLTYTARIAQTPLTKPGGVELKAACQIGADRLIDVEPAVGELKQGVAVELEESAFMLHPLPAGPTMCELTFTEASYDAPRLIDRLCWDGAVKSGPCPANAISNVDVGETGVTAMITKVTPEDADDIGFPAHLTIEYRATAHKDMPRGAWFVRLTSCPGSRTDDTWHDELQYLHAGESLLAAQNTYKLGRPAAGTPCETTLGYAQAVNGEVTEIATFCHRDTAITRGACSRR